MNNIQLGRLKSVDIQELWKNDQKAFSEWLSLPGNIEYLNEISGLLLKDVKRDVSAGPCKCNLTAKDGVTGGQTVIECQLDASSHEHLGKIITYTSGSEISVVIWIVKEAREEHRRAIQWLNKNITSGIRFFLIELHVYQIENSLPAPVFRIMEQPKGAAGVNKKFSERTKADASISGRLEFWTYFNSVLEDRGKPFNVKKPSSYPWYDVALGTSEARISIDLIDELNKVALEVYIRDNKDLFDHLYSYKDNIEAALSMKLDWDRADGKKSSKIKYDLPGLNFHDHSNYPELMNEIIDKVVKMRAVFKRYL